MDRKITNIYNVVYLLAGSKVLVFDKRRDSKMNCLSSHFAYIVLLWYTSVILCLLSSVSLSAVFFMMSPEQKHPMFGSFSPLILFWQQQVSHLWSKLVANYVAYQSNGITRTRCTYEFVHYLQNSLRIWVQIRFFDHESKRTIGRTYFLWTWRNTFDQLSDAYNTRTLIVPDTRWALQFPDDCDLC